MGRSMSKTKLACFQVKKKFMSDMEAKQNSLLNKVHELQDELARVKQVGDFSCFQVKKKVYD